MKNIFTAAILSLYFACAVTGQNIATTLWIDTIGAPGITVGIPGLFYNVAVPYSDSNTLINSNIVLTGISDTVTNIGLYSGGTPVWSENLSFTGYSDNVSTANYLKGAYAFSCGSVFNGAPSNSGIYTCKLNRADGSLAWDTVYNGLTSGYEVPYGMLVDDSLNIYVAATEQKSLTEFEMTIIKYSPTGQQLFVTHYDTANMYTGAVGLVLSGSNLIVTGFSGTLFSSWSYVTASFNLGTGALQSVSWSGNSGANFNAPVGILKDVYGSDTGASAFLVAGTATAGTGKTTIKTIMYDSLLNIIWMNTWGDSTTNNSAAGGLAIDGSGNPVITGYTTVSGVKQTALIKYNRVGGSLAWAKQIPAPNPAYNAQGNAVAADGYGIYVASQVSNGARNMMVTTTYDLDGNPQWQKTYSRTATSNEQPNSIIPPSFTGGAVITTGTSYDNDTLYIAVAYGENSAFLPTDSFSNNSPFAFYPNMGQLRSPDTLSADSILYYTANGTPQLFVKYGTLSYVFGTTDSTHTLDTTRRIDMNLVLNNESDPSVGIYTCGMPVQEYLNFFMGYMPKPAGNVQGYNQLVEKDVFGGIDWEICSTQRGMRNYFIVSPGADYSQILLQFKGADSISIATGAMQLFTGKGYLQMDTPIAYDVDGMGDTFMLAISHYDHGGGEYSFNISGHNTANYLVVDPTLSEAAQNSCSGNLAWSTYYGGRSDDKANDIKIDNSGNVFITGYTTSANFPATSDVINDSISDNFKAAFVVKFDTGGAWQWGTYFGGENYDGVGGVFGTTGVSIAIDASADVFVCGNTDVTDFPVRPNPPAYQDTSVGQSFICKIDNGSGTMDWASYFAGAQNRIFFTSANVLYMAGSESYLTATTYALDTTFPFTRSGSAGAYYNATGIGTITKFNSNLQIAWATGFGGLDYFYLAALTGIAEGPNNTVFFTGYADTGSNFPIVSSGSDYSQAHAYGVDGVIIKFNNNDSLLYSTFFGGNGDDYFTNATSTFTDEGGYNLYICGFTLSTNFPCYNGIGADFFIDSSFYGRADYVSDVVIIDMENDDDTLLYSSYYGGNGQDQANGITVGAYNMVYVTGLTESQNLQIVAPADYYSYTAGYNSDDGAPFIAAFNLHGTPTLDWSTYLGDFGGGQGNGVAATGYKLYVTGATDNGQTATVNNGVFPLCNLDGAYNQSSLNLNNQVGTWDAFITEFNLNPSATGIPTIAANPHNIKVYPNPTDGWLYILNGNLLTGDNIKIVNIFGQVVYSAKYLGGVIDISNLAPAMYILKCVTDDGTETTKFIKQ